MDLLRAVRKIILAVLIYMITTTVFMLVSTAAFVGKSIKKLFRKIRRSFS